MALTNGAFSLSSARITQSFTEGEAFMIAACLLLSMCYAGAPPSVLALLDREIELKGKTHKQFERLHVAPPRRTLFNLWAGEERIYWNGLLRPIQDQRIKEFYDQLPGAKDRKAAQAFLLQKFPLGSSIEQLEVTLLLQGFSSRRILTTLPHNNWTNRVDLIADGTVFPPSFFNCQRYGCRLFVRHDDEGRLTELTVTQSARLIVIAIMP
jgi:hypothetical protein